MIPASASSITVVLNGETKEIQGTGIAALLRQMGRDPQEFGIAIAVNDKVVPRSQWSSVTFGTGDVIEIVTAKQGG